MLNVKKILVISNMYPSPREPALGVFVERVSAQMIDRGHDVTLAVRCASRWKMLSYLRFFIHAFGKVLFSKADLVYVHFVTHSYIPVMFAFLLRSMPLAVHVHGADIISDKKQSRLSARCFSIVRRAALGRAALIVAPSNYFRDLVSERFPSVKDKIVVSPSGGVDLAAFRDASSSARVRGELMFFGRLMLGKGVMLVIPAVEAVRARRSDLEVSVVFAGDGPALAALSEQAKASAVSVRFLGAVDPHRVPQTLSTATALVFPSFRQGESLGLVALEGMACGRPVIAARSGAMEEIVQDGVNGALFEINDIHGLSLAIESMLTLDDLAWKRVSDAALRRVEAFDAQRVSLELSEALCRVF